MGCVEAAYGRRPTGLRLPSTLSWANGSTIPRVPSAASSMRARMQASGILRFRHLLSVIGQARRTRRKSSNVAAWLAWSNQSSSSDRLGWLLIVSTTSGRT
jgi:hypothetical protein